MSSDCIEVNNILSALLLKVKACKEPLRVLAVGNALYGLQGMKKSNEYVQFLDFLYNNIDRSSMKSPQIDFSPRYHLESLSLALAFLLPTLRENYIDQYEKWVKIDRTLSEELYKRKEKNGPRTQSLLAAELRVLAVAREILKDTNTDIICNDYLFNLFESDIVLKISRNKEDTNKILSIAQNIAQNTTQNATQSSAQSNAQSHINDNDNNNNNNNNNSDNNSSSSSSSSSSINFDGFGDQLGNHTDNHRDDNITLNIEIDGIRHFREKKKRFCKLRDEHLRSKGIVIERIQASHLRKMNLTDLEKWVLDKVATTLLQSELESEVK